MNTDPSELSSFDSTGRLRLNIRMQDSDLRRIVRWRKVFGEGIDELLKDIGIALHCVKTDSGSRKRVGIEVLSLFWKTPLTEHYADLLEGVIWSDDIDEVREAAVFAYGLAGKNNRDVDKLSDLAWLMLDSCESDLLRRSAYVAMCIIAGKTIPFFPSRRKSENGSGLISFPSDVDWDFVAKCASRNEGSRNLDHGTARLSSWEREAICQAIPELKPHLVDKLTLESTGLLIERCQSWALHSFRSVLLLRKGLIQESIKEATIAIEMNPLAFEPYLTRALANYQIQRRHLGDSDVRKYEERLSSMLQVGC